VRLVLRSPRAVRAFVFGCFAAALVSSLACGSSERPPGPGTSGAGDGGSNGGAGGAASGGSGESGSASTDVGGGTNAGSGGLGAGGSAPPEPPACVPQQNCRTICSALAVDPSGCGFGHDGQCGCICEQRLNGPCPAELQALLACTGAAPSVQCSTQGRIFSGCESESVALELCDFRAREQLCAQSYPRCTSYCQAATLSYCPLGPESVSSCLCGCEASLAVTCAAEFDAFMVCSSDAPDFACDGLGRPTPEACSVEWQSLLDCSVGAPDPAPDAG
jgi:hypothetical protein